MLKFRLAIRYIFTPNAGSFSSRASWLAIIGFSIGIASLLLTASVIKGFELTISNKLSIYDGSARVQHILNKPIPRNNSILDTLINTLEYGQKIKPFIRGLSMIRFGKSADGVLIDGLENLHEKLNVKWLGGFRQNNALNRGEIVLGKQLVDELDLEQGETVFLQELSMNSNLLIKPFKYVGVFHSGLSEYDKTLAYIQIKDAESIFSYDDDHVSGWIIYSDIYSQMNFPEISYPFFIETWKERHKLLFDWIKIQKWPAMITFGLIALIGLVNIVASLSMIIFEKKSQIGVLISQGLDNSSIQKIFIFQGGLIGFLGCCFGGLISIIIIFIQSKFQVFSIEEEIYFMDHIPIVFDINIFVFIIGFSFCLSMLASIWPTKKLLELEPSQALKY
ncbi:MAG: hypothetical protein CMG62_05580 [Candidatus Marinimicrobia bacterium]|nr:hypothetical protein [Candidatus Neomarinimicrobiota bacterium]